MLVCKICLLSLVVTIMLATTQEQSFEDKSGNAKLNTESSKTVPSETIITDDGHIGNKITGNLSSNASSSNPTVVETLKGAPYTSKKGINDQ